MQRGVSVHPLSAAGVLHVAQHMRASDRAELWAVSPDGCDAPDVLAAGLHERSRWGAVVHVDGKPAVAMGAIPCWPGTVAVWLFATDAWPRAWRATLRWLREHLPATMRASRTDCAFVFAATGRGEVERFLRAVGFVRRGIVPQFGRGGEPFALWSVAGNAR